MANQGALKLLEQDEARSQRVAAALSVGSAAASEWEGLFGSSPTSSGVSVTADSAERVSAVYACISVISKTVATLPLHVYKRMDGGGKERAYEHPLYSLLHDAPNDIMTSTEAREMMQGYACGVGNTYALVDRNGAGRVTAITPYPNDKVSVFKKGARLWYQVQTDEGLVTVGSDSVIHVRGRSKDGILGMSPIACARESIGLAMVTEKHGASLFGNGARPSGVITTPGQLSPDKIKALQDAWEERHKGTNAMMRPAVVFGGTTYTPFSLSNEDAQFLETRNFQVTDIARWFGVPPHMIADLAKATFSNIEHQSLEFVIHCIRPWLVRWEQRMNVVLFTESERSKYFVEFSVDGLLRGDLKSRYEAYTLGRNAGILSADDCRDMENMNRIEGGDTYLQPMNMGELGNFQTQTPSKGSTQ